MSISICTITQRRVPWRQGCRATSCRYNVERIHSSLDYRTPMADVPGDVQRAATQIMGKFLEKGLENLNGTQERGWRFSGRGEPWEGAHGPPIPLSKKFAFTGLDKPSATSVDLP